MDLVTLEQQYRQLLQEDQGVIQGLQALAAKLKTAAEGGHQDAREWMQDLKNLALSIQAEQQQMMVLLQALHQATQNEVAAIATTQPDQISSSSPSPWQPSYPQTPKVSLSPSSRLQMAPQVSSGNYLNNPEYSEFGQMLMMGSRFGIGDAFILRHF